MILYSTTCNKNLAWRKQWNPLYLCILQIYARRQVKLLNFIKQLWCLVNKLWCLVHRHWILRILNILDTCWRWTSLHHGGSQGLSQECISLHRRLMLYLLLPGVLLWGHPCASQFLRQDQQSHAISWQIQQSAPAEKKIWCTFTYRNAWYIYVWLNLIVKSAHFFFLRGWGQKGSHANPRDLG